MDQDMYPELKSDLITITITQDSLDYRLMDSLIQVTFKNKNLPQEYQLHHFKKDTLFDSYPRNMEDKPFPMTYFAILILCLTFGTNNEDRFD